MTNFILVPGAGGEAWYWHVVAPRLRALGHTVAAPDLPAGDDSAGLAEYADAIVAAGGDRPVVLVAHSMGAFSAPMACDRLEVERIDLVCPMIPAPAETPGDWWSTSGHAEPYRASLLAAGRDPDAPFDERATFFHDVPSAVVDAAYARGEPRQSDTPLADPWPLERWPDVPTRVLVGRRDRIFPLAFAQRLARERLGAEADIIDTGHLPSLARPDELTEWLTS
jgi:pimeloyl-ACP methyl ester carboxylesterase